MGTLLLPVISSIMLLAWLVLRESIQQILRSVSGMILAFGDEAAPSKEDTFLNSIEYKHLSSLVKRIVDYREELAVGRIQLKLSRQLAHDLRSPINGLKVVVKSLRAGKDPATIQYLLDSTIHRLTEMTNEILQLEGTINKDINQIDVLEMVMQVCFDTIPIERISKVVIFKNTAAMMQFSPLMPRESFIRILQNLIVNAYEAAVDEKQITIEFMEEMNVSRLRIADNGCGFRKDVLTGISNGDYFSTKVGGHGLGLEYVFKTLKQHDAKLHIIKSDHQGTHIEISFNSKKIREFDFNKRAGFILPSQTYDFCKQYVNSDRTDAFTENIEIQTVEHEQSSTPYFKKNGFLLSGSSSLSTRAMLGYWIERRSDV